MCRHILSKRAVVLCKSEKFENIIMFNFSWLVKEKLRGGSGRGEGGKERRAKRQGEVQNIQRASVKHMGKYFLNCYMHIFLRQMSTL